MLNRQTWYKVPNEKATELLDSLILIGAKQELGVNNKCGMAWQVRKEKEVVRFYSKGTLFCEPVMGESVPELRHKIYELLGEPYKEITREYVIGLDETGASNAESGDMILTGVRFPADLYEKVKAIVGVANTKNKRSYEYWNTLHKQIEPLEKVGLVHYSEKIPESIRRTTPIHKLLDEGYCKLVSRLVTNIPPDNCSITVDDFGVKDNMKVLLNGLKDKGFLVRIEFHADDNYLETKLASIISKAERIQSLY